MPVGTGRFAEYCNCSLGDICLISALMRWQTVDRGRPTDSAICRTWYLCSFRARRCRSSSGVHAILICALIAGAFLGVRQHPELAPKQSRLSAFQSTTHIHPPSRKAFSNITSSSQTPDHAGFNTHKRAARMTGPARLRYPAEAFINAADCDTFSA